ncbi:reverse transcriptase (RNA-dependent DNA polymerase) [Hirsutella rhossiliensis]
MKDTLSGPTSPLESASTYAASRQPSRLTDLRGVEINFDEAVKEEIACQTGLKPISIRTSRHDSGDMPTKTLIVSFLEPTQRPWRLFGASRFARYIDKPSIPSQCVVAKPAIVAKNAPPSSSVQTALDPIARMTPNALPAPSAFTAWSGA